MVSPLPTVQTNAAIRPLFEFYCVTVSPSAGRSIAKLKGLHPAPLVLCHTTDWGILGQILSAERVNLARDGFAPACLHRQTKKAPLWGPFCFWCNRQRMSAISAAQAVRSRASLSRPLPILSPRAALCTAKRADRTFRVEGGPSLSPDAPPHPHGSPPHRQSLVANHPLRAGSPTRSGYYWKVTPIGHGAAGND